LIKVTEFESRQLTAARKEPEAEIDLKTKPSKEAAQKLSSGFRT
jgi:hypothetical protein